MRAVSPAEISGGEAFFAESPGTAVDSLQTVRPIGGPGRLQIFFDDAAAGTGAFDAR